MIRTLEQWAKWVTDIQFVDRVRVGELKAELVSAVCYMNELHAEIATLREALFAKANAMPQSIGYNPIDNKREINPAKKPVKAVATVTDNSKIIKAQMKQLLTEAFVYEEIDKTHAIDGLLDYIDKKIEFVLNK